MNRIPEHAWYITFEGLDGAGKDTLLDFMATEIRKDNSRFNFGSKYMHGWVTREPTRSTVPGQEINRLLKSGQEIQPAEAVEYFIKDRILHSDVIRRYIAGVNGIKSCVLSSRGDLSTYAYQSAQGIGLEEMFDKHTYGPSGACIPDITVVVDVEPETGMQRVSNRGEGQEFYEQIEFQQIVYNKQEEAIKFLQRRQPERMFLKIDGNGTIEKAQIELVQKMNDAVKTLYSKRQSNV